MCAFGLNIDHIDGLACGDVQLVPLDTTKTKVGADFRELNQADSLPLWAEDVNAIVAIANPATRTPDIAFDITTKAIRDATRLGPVLHRHLHACEDTTIGGFLAIHDVIDADFLGAIRVGDVQLFVVRREAEAVWLGDVIKHLLNFAGLAIDAVDGFLQLVRSLLAFVVALRAVAWIGKPDTAIRVYNDIIWSVELLPVELVCKNRDCAIVFIACHASR